MLAAILAGGSRWDAGVSSGCRTNYAWEWQAFNDVVVTMITLGMRDWSRGSGRLRADARTGVLVTGEQVFRLVVLLDGVTDFGGEGADEEAAAAIGGGEFVEHGELVIAANEHEVIGPAWLRCGEAVWDVSKD